MPRRREGAKKNILLNRIADILVGFIGQQDAGDPIAFMKILVLAEKPSVGKELARVLQCPQAAKGYCEGADYVITWALGHLVTLAEPHVYDEKLKTWRMEDLPMLPQKMKLQVIKESAHQFKVVRELMQREEIGELIIATDAGREGELVARWIMKLGGWGRKPFKRLWISSQTDEAIRQGFTNLKPGSDYNRLFNSALCRAEADWLIGLNVTRALTCKFDASLNAGRVQTPTLAIIAAREQDIRQFRPVEYWTVVANFGGYIGTWRNDNGNGRLFDRAQAQELAKRVEGRTGVITEVSVKEKSEPPPLAYDLTELQRDANRIYGLSAQQTLAVVQSLYERYKLVTYPRTDSRYITTDLVETLPRRLQSIAVEPYTPLVEPLLQQPLAPGKRFVNDSKVSDHHALLPTEQSPDLDALRGDEKRMYDLIVRRFLAVLYPPYRYDRTTIVTKVNGEKFYSQGKVEKELGWKAVERRAVAPDDLPAEDALPEQTLDAYQVGEEHGVKGVTLAQAKTRPPARYTEATLLTAMESPGRFIEDEELRESIKAGGLGTPATRAEIIEKLIGNNYVERDGKSLLPTTKAFQLLELVPSDLKSPELTAKWEFRLSNIAKGQDNRHDFMEDIRQNAITLVNLVRQNSATYKPTEYDVPRDASPAERRKFKKAGKMRQRTNKNLPETQSASTNLGALLKAALEQKE